MPVRRALLRRIVEITAVHRQDVGDAHPLREPIAQRTRGHRKVGIDDIESLFTAELQATSADFRRLWEQNEMRSRGIGRKRLRHPSAGWLDLEYSSLFLDGAGGLGLMVYTPVTPADTRAIEALLSRPPSTR